MFAYWGKVGRIPSQQIELQKKFCVFITQLYSRVYWVNDVQSNVVQDVHQPPIAEYEDPTAPVLLQVQRNDKLFKTHFENIAIQKEQLFV